MSTATHKPHSKRHKEEESEVLKPYDFCCSSDYIDPLTKYDDKNKFLRKSLFASANIINESPVLKFETQFSGYVGSEQAKQSVKNKHADIGDHRRRLHSGQGAIPPYTSHNLRLQSRFGSSYINLQDKWTESLKWGPIEWYIEDEITEAKDMLWEQKQRIFNKEMDRNVKIGNEKFNLSMDKKLSKFPSWYQDFSIDQMKNIMMLQCVIRRDCEEMVSGRTERMLIDIGIVSTFFLLTPNIIRKLQETSNCDAIKFLREIYKVLTGNYFEEEEYKHFYDCNERIILSAIAFLTLPETIMELHKRLPPVVEPKLPNKPLPPSLPIRRKKKSPYEDDLFICPDWASYYNRIQIWRARYQLLPKPKIILPPKECILTEYTSVETSREHEENEGRRKADRGSSNGNKLYQTEQSLSSRVKRKWKREEEEEEEKEGGNKKKTSSALVKEQQKGSITKKHSRDSRSTEQEVNKLKEANKEEATFDIARLPNGSKVFDFTINGVSEKPGPVEYKICGVLQTPRPYNKSWLGEKHPHYIVSGAAENPPSCPITYEMTGVANVTPTNSNEKFFAVLKLGDGPKKIYPCGRKNLSPKWQEWLQNVDEEFRKIEREMKKLIKNIGAITRLVFPGPKCDNCCSCRQSRKSYIKGKEVRTPYFVIDTIAEDSKKNKCIIGSMAMHSPAPTPPESTVNLLEVIASEDVLATKLMINGVTNPKGETQYYISGITDEIIHQPSRIVERPPPGPPRNVPPCVCAIQQISAKGLTQGISHDHIPWTKEDGLCFGKKFRPHEAPAVSCKMYPGDKSCRRNPFYRQIVDMKRRVEETKRKSIDPSEEKRMYSIADFPPCGDEHGMSICGAPWGRLHTLTPQELEELEKLRKQILRGPPCGTKPGRAVCKGPFGERIPRKKPAIDLKEIPGEFDEEEEEEEEEEEDAEEKVKETKVVGKEKERKRDKKCLTSPDILASKQKTKEEKAAKKFIPDPLYPGYDDTWNIHRTAPSEKESETDFQALLKLSSPKPPATPAESLPKNTSKSRKDTEKIAVSRLAKSSAETHSSETNRMNKIANKRKKKSSVTKDTREIYGKGSLGTRAKSEGTVFNKSTKSDKTGDSKEPTRPKVGSLRTKGNGKATIPIKQISKNLNSNLKGEKRSFHEKPKSKKIEAKSKPATGLISQQAKDNGNKIVSEKNERSDDKNRSGTTKNKSNPKKNSPARHEKEKEDKVFNLNKKKHKRKDLPSIENESIDPRKQILDLKKMLMSPDNYPPNVKPVDLPEELQTECAHEYGHLHAEDDSTTVVEETDVQLPSKGPCGWRTKSEQQLPTKKTLVYLCEPDYPPETIEVRTGGKPCVCRENRAKKKVLMYNIGGLVRGKKDDTDYIDGKLFKKKKNEEDKKLQVIEGIIYHTPPLSPRRSDEYVPEYDLYKSPYDMCHSKRTDENLKYLERFGVPKISASKSFKQSEPCGCNESVDVYDIIQEDDRVEKADSAIEELEKNRQELVKRKPPKERWELALKDIGLIDYYTRCRDSMPCWLKCRKFNRTGCGPPRARLVVKRPVCECKYERKILENKEEKVKWKERREKLKSLKKQPFINIENTSKPVVADTKLMISGVKRIPREDEYIDDVKYSITGVVENYTEEPPKPIVSGVRMATPIQTPEPSVEEIPCVCLHRHWSPVNIPPGPLPKPEELQRAEDYKRKMATEKAYRQIHVPDKVYDSHGTHSCDKTCNSNSASEDEGVQEGSSNGTMLLSKKIKQRRRSDSTSKQISKDNTERSKLRSKSDKSVENPRDIIIHSPKKPEQEEIRNFLREKTDIRRVVESTKSQSSSRTRSKLSKTTKTDSHLQHTSTYSKEKLVEAATDKEDSEISYDSHLMTLVKNELSKLATEGFLFAKLPKCFLLPQLRYWLMYRKGIALSNTDRDDSVRKSIVMWNSLNVGNVSRIEPPSIGMTKLQLRKLTFDDADRIKEQIIKKKAIFYSQVRKDRVLYARSMWNTMDYGKYPDMSFKEAFFTYMASKEADGYVFKPWFRSDVRNVVT